MVALFRLFSLPCCFSLAVLLLLATTTTVVYGDSHTPKDFFGGHDSFVSWLDQHAQGYADHAFFHQDGQVDQGVSVHWSLTETHLELAVAVRASGWLAFGLSENGGMQGSDVLLFEAANPDTVLDAHILGVLQPVVDDCQNWEFVRSEVSMENFLMVQVRRLIDTGDKQDRVLVEDGTLELPASLIIAAWGDEENYQYHGPNKARGTLRWYNESLSGEEAFGSLMEAADGYFEMRGKNHPIKPIDTEYFDYCFTWDELLTQGIPDEPFSVIGFRPIQDAVEHLHHYTLFGSKDPMNGQPCSAFTMASHNDLVYGWARGEPPVPLPLDVGLTIGPGSYQSFRLEIHYDNPQLKTGVFDSSGIRFYYINGLREKELGLLRLGDPIIGLDKQPLGEGLTQHEFYCPSSCTDLMLKEEVTVLREYLHMHYIGSSMQNELIRDGEVIHTGSVDYFNFDMQGNQVVQQQPYTVKQGDAFRTVCNFDNRGKNGTFGYSSQEEMCITFIMYYPKQSFANGLVSWTCAYDMGFNPCEEEYTKRTLEEIPRVFGVADDQCVEPFGPPEEDEPEVDESSAVAMTGWTVMAAALLLAAAGLQ